MTLIHTSLPPEALDGDWGKLSPDAALELTAPGKEPLQVLNDALVMTTSMITHTAWLNDANFLLQDVPVNGSISQTAVHLLFATLQAMYDMDVSICAGMRHRSASPHRKYAA